MKRQRVLMVCLGNICRSPTAEAVLRHRLEAAGLADRVEVDSAGTRVVPRRRAA
jgi:protein-tyrosine phosphatase